MSIVHDGAVTALAFFAYSFIGWAYESTIWAKAEKKEFINRGMLLGPICPIYGLVALVDWQMFYRIENPVVIFFGAGIVCCIFEYIISWWLEKIFHQRWWDYSNYPLNLHGRISLPSGFFFGTAGLFLVKIVHPFTLRTIAMLPDRMIYVLAVSVAGLFLVDIIVTAVSIGMKAPPLRLKRLYETVARTTAQPFDYLNEAIVPLETSPRKQMLLARRQMRYMQKKVHSGSEKIKEKFSFSDKK